MGRTRGGKENPVIGAFRLPARPVFAVGRGSIQDPAEYRRLVTALRRRKTSSRIAGR